MAVYYVDGDFVDAEQATLPLSDLAILRGYGVFDFLRTYNGKPFHLEEHLERLRKSAELLYIPCPWTTEYMSGVVSRLLEENGFEESNIRLLITGGDSADSITPMDNPRLIVMATALKTFPAEWYSHGVKIITSAVTRYIPGSKSTNYIKAIVALRRARSGGAVESVYVNENGELLEGTTSNLFAVRKGTVITPENDILPGITREVVLQLAAEEFAVERAGIREEELGEFSEFFLTSSNKEVLPVVAIDDRLVADRPGPVTMRIMEMFRKYTSSWQGFSKEEPKPF